MNIKPIGSERRVALLGFLVVLIWTMGSEAVPPGYSSKIVQVRLRDDAKAESIQAILPAELDQAVATKRRLFTPSEQRLDALKVRGESRILRKLSNLNRWFQITLKEDEDADRFMQKLKQIDSVEIVEPAPLPVPPPAITPDFMGLQGHLGDSPNGIAATYAWTLPGGNGNGVTIYDVEYGWNQAHEDLTTAHTVEPLMNDGDTAINPFGEDHGTAVLGELIANIDGKGVTGIAWGAFLGLAPVYTEIAGYNPANAILLVVEAGSPGDVILIEQQYPVCGLSAYGPSEWVSSVFDAIQTAVANGFIVVEAAGNGNVNLDQAGCAGLFNRTVRDSGAILVGAGGPGASGLDRQRLSFSTYGSRLDLQGWGSSVVTTGYGSFYNNPDDSTNANFWYTGGFNGTSSATPMVAGAAASLQGISLAHFGSPLDPFELRTLLRNTGSPQLGNTAERIGPRPNLQNAIGSLMDIIFSDNFESGDLSAWSANQNNAGDLSVSSSAALVGAHGMEAVIDDNAPIYVTDKAPDSEARYRARFYFDPNSITMGASNRHTIFQGYSTADKPVFRIELERSTGGNYVIRSGLLNDSTAWKNTGWVTLSDRKHSIEFDWKAATRAGANDGVISLWLDNVLVGKASKVDNDTRRIASVRLGAVEGIDTGTRGTYYFDAFQSRRQTMIGPVALSASFASSGQDP